MKIDWTQIPYFESLARCDLSLIENAAHHHAYLAGATIFGEGESCAGFHIVLDGLVRIYRMNVEGRLHTLSLLRPLSTFNEVAAVDGGVNPFNAVAVAGPNCAIPLLIIKRYDSDPDLTKRVGRLTRSLRQVTRNLLWRHQSIGLGSSCKSALRPAGSSRPVRP